MLRALPLLLAALVLSGARTLAAQTSTTLASPTLPSDTLEANYAPRSAPAPTPELAPTLPSDTLEATEPVGAFPDDSYDDEEETDSLTPDSSSALRELRSWIEHHPALMGPPPVRAVSARA